MKKPGQGMVWILVTYFLQVGSASSLSQLPILSLWDEAINGPIHSLYQSLHELTTWDNLTETVHFTNNPMGIPYTIYQC